MTYEAIKDDIENIRDIKTPDLFHTFTENDIEIIASKLGAEPTARFKKYLTTDTIREYVIFVLNNNPRMCKIFHRYKLRPLN